MKPPYNLKKIVLIGMTEKCAILTPFMLIQNFLRNFFIKSHYITYYIYNIILFKNKII